MGGPLEQLLKEIGFVLAPHDGGNRQGREDIQVSSAEKSIALASDGFEVLGRRRRVAQGRPDFLHTHPQHGVGHMGSRPDVLAQLCFRHQPIGMLSQIAEHRQGPGAQGHALFPAPQAAMRHIKTERSKSEVMLLLHGLTIAST